MEIKNCSIGDANEILSLYEAARKLQTEKKMVVWPFFKKPFIEKEIREQRQWKIVIDNCIACNWAIIFNDKDIWEEKEKDDAIYIHRVATHPAYRGNRYINNIVEWAKTYAKHKGKQFVRLDTLGNNTGLIKHYTSAGFHFLGIFKLADITNLPGHYHKEPDCLLFEISI
jgi:ribosomal protein S18 acetylase RimI-like enzyme